MNKVNTKDQDEEKYDYSNVIAGPWTFGQSITALFHHHCFHHCFLRRLREEHYDFDELQAFLNKLNEIADGM